MAPAPDRAPSRGARAYHAVAVGVAVAGIGLARWLAPDEPRWLIAPVALSAIAFLYGVRAYVKPPRTGAEEH